MTHEPVGTVICAPFIVALLAIMLQMVVKKIKKKTAQPANSIYSSTPELYHLACRAICNWQDATLPLSIKTI